jgi:hypothetical protein
VKEERKPVRNLDGGAKETAVALKAILLTAEYDEVAVLDSVTLTPTKAFVSPPLEDKFLPPLLLLLAALEAFDFDLARRDSILTRAARHARRYGKSLSLSRR